jgi:hypothetical protein
MSRQRRPHAVAVDWKGVSAVTLWEAGVTRDRRGLVRVPYRLPDGRTAKSKVFAPNGGTWWSPIGVDQIPLGLDMLPPAEGRQLGTLIIAEGETDCLALREALAEDIDGYPIDVIGLPGAGSWRPAWAEYVFGYSRAYVVGDGDAAGQRMMDGVARSVPWVRQVRLPEGEDARSLLQRRGDRVLDAYLDKADEVAILGAAISLAPTLVEFHAVMGTLE